MGSVNSILCGVDDSPQSMEALRRVKASTTEKRLLDASGNPGFQLDFYAVSKKGEYAGVSMYASEDGKPERFAVCTEKGPELLACESLLGDLRNT